MNWQAHSDLTQSNSPDISYGANDHDVNEQTDASDYFSKHHDLTICERDLEMEEEAKSHHFERNHAHPSFNRNLLILAVLNNTFQDAEPCH